MDEARAVTDIARRITAIMLMEPDLDATTKPSSNPPTPGKPLPEGVPFRSRFASRVSVTPPLRAEATSKKPGFFPFGFAQGFGWRKRSYPEAL